MQTPTPTVSIPLRNDAGAGGLSRALLFAVIIAAVIRIVVALVGVGSNDTVLWHQFGREVWTWPVGDVWRFDRYMNNPAVPALYAGLVYGVAGEHLYAFSLWFKLPSIIAEVISTWLIGRIVFERTASIRATRFAAVAYALNPAAILVSSYHGNIDAVLAMFSLIAWREAARGRFGWAGLAAGAAINCKVAAAPAALLLLGCARSRRQFFAALAALAFMALPFVAAVAVVGRPFLEQTLLYRPQGGLWLMALPDELRRWDVGAALMGRLSVAHASILIQCTLLAIVLLAAWWHRRGRRRVDLLHLGALFWTALLLWIGGPYQYAIWPLPLLAATRPAIALAYGIGAGAWLLWSYIDACVATWPFQSLFASPDPTRSRLALPLPPTMLVIAIVSLTRGTRARSDAVGVASDRG